MAAMRGPRLQVGSASWVAEERKAALQIANSEVEEFSYSARNELDWLNEHMAGIFNENETNFAETFKTPGKLRGKTPRTARKGNPLESRVPLSEVFSATPRGSPSPVHRLNSPKHIANSARGSPSPLRHSAPRRPIFSPKSLTQPAVQDSGYFGSQDVGSVNIHMDTDAEEGYVSRQLLAKQPTTVPLKDNSRTGFVDSPEKTFQTAKEEQTIRVSAETNKEAKGAVNRDNISPTTGTIAPVENTGDYLDDERSASDASSPIRPVVRKSSLNFASLPAREPLAGGKSIGGRVSRTSHLDQIRTSYYSRPTEGKSAGSHAKLDVEDDDPQDIKDTDTLTNGTSDENSASARDAKTYTQRLQDQINMLGKSQPKPPTTLHAPKQSKTPAPKSPSPKVKSAIQTTPGAFPEDDDDDWIDPPATADDATGSRPGLPKSHTADVMEGIQGMQTIGQPEFVSSDDEETCKSGHMPARGLAAKAVYGHGKSVSVSAIPTIRSAVEDAQSLKKVASNPSLMVVSEKDGRDSPSKSPARSFRESPLKQVKNKLSSILKSSRGLLASSAAISAEGKSLMSPSSTRLGFHGTKSTESLALKQAMTSQEVALQDSSPSRPPVRRTRASVEKEEKKREKEAKLLEEQNEKLNKAREKEREKARVFSKEQDKIAAMEKQVALKKSEEKVDRLMAQETPKPTRSSPRHAKPAVEDAPPPADHDVEMEDAPPAAPPSIARPAGPANATRNKETKRPVKPTRETQTRPKQAPMVIKVNTGSQHSQYRLSTASHDTVGHAATQPQTAPTTKASKAPLHPKPSMQSLRSGTAAANRSKAQEIAAKKKEQEDKEAQKRREAKAELERKRVAQEEQRRQDQQRRQEAERQKQQQQEQSSSQPQAKTNAQRKAAIEKAKQTRAPPPAVRSQPNGPPDAAVAQSSQRPPSRMTSNAYWSQEDPSRPVNAVLSNAPKAGTKRTLAQEKSEASQAQRPPSRGGPTYQQNEAKRRRTSDGLGEDQEGANPRNIRDPPVRPPSVGFKKELPPKATFHNGYTTAPPSATRDLFKAAVSAQHAAHMKAAANPLDMAQISKGAIPFAPNPNHGGAAYKTPARPGPAQVGKSAAKSVPRSSPRFQNGEAIELPEIETDEDSEDDEANDMVAAPWADPERVRLRLIEQEIMDPSQIFGPPGPLNMEEIFSKNKDRWHKFRARTSSANWSGADKLTEDDIRKDMAARDKLRRDGGWSYEMGKDMI